jgi:hypothetical protein
MTHLIKKQTIMNLPRLFVFVLITIPEFLFSQQYLMGLPKKTYSDEVIKLKQNDFKLFESAILESNAEFTIKYFHTKTDTNEINLF